MEDTDASTALDPHKVARMIQACSTNNLVEIDSLLMENAMYARQQDETTGKSPLMAAAEAGFVEICKLLLDHGAPWNALDRFNQCAGNFATEKQHWDVVNLLVDAGTAAELVLGASIRLQQQQQNTTTTATLSTTIPVEHAPCTKPDYLQQPLQYTNSALLDKDNDAVMMSWERPLMQAHASLLTCNQKHKRVLNVGFGMGIIDTALQEYQPSLHIIIEAHPDVYNEMKKMKWLEKENVRVCFGKWQDVIPQLIQEGVKVDGIFYDTYGEHFLDLEDFHSHALPELLDTPNGVYSFFNGLAPDNLFFHGVACQCVKLQLASLGFESEFVPCEITVPEQDEWEGIRRKYWHGRDTYYLPHVTWKATDETTTTNSSSTEGEEEKIKAVASRQGNDDNGTNAKRQKVNES
jgi:protein arginine N-methyltransferase 2